MQQLRLMVLDDSAGSFHLDEYRVGHDQIGSVVTHNVVVEDHFNCRFELNACSQRANSVGQRLLIDAFEESVAELIIDIKERAQDFIRRFTLD